MLTKHNFAFSLVLNYFLSLHANKEINLSPLFQRAGSELFISDHSGNAAVHVYP